MTDTALSPALGPTRSAQFRDRVLPFLAFAAVLVAIPAFGPSRTWLTLFNSMGINIVFALSYTMLLGRAGLLSFGHAVYFGLGGYLAMHLMAAIPEGVWGVAGVFALPVVGFAGGAVAGAVIGWPSCRRAGIPFAMISLGIAELVASAAFIFVSVFGGEEGISGDRMKWFDPIAIGGLEIDFTMGPLGDVYWFIAFWTFLATVLMYAFTRTPLGRMSEAVRDNPERAAFVGYNPQQVRYLVFIAAGGFAGVGGGMAAVNFEIFTPENLSLAPSGFVLLMAYIGGIRYFAGPILGAVVLTWMQSSFSAYTEAWLLYLGLLFIVIVMFAPDGLAGVVARLAKGVTAPGAAPRLGRWAGRTVAALVALTGVVVLVEVAVRWSGGYGETFEPFGLPLPADEPITWVLVGVPIALGLTLLRLAATGDEP
ncbi:branched-chain amino acid ABC transporter permease [Acuticoccus yangtzensis]|uniref:branched-chain amino acid ABC transporter permease n=1 Tax=Acuticoccus yangtzensis TaxID=1443441 RepID=UPI00094966D8|nr:branched-chain amino acid ABC transporter permease [Acuticoccus yangtzensis]ORE91510.1 High-affinity branched-chain amino acid transport system permease protein LivM (LIV-I protein M) [Stappia sp. 22II-S9-Z10]